MTGENIGPKVDIGSPSSETENFVEEISSEDFEQWYREREFARNIRQGQPYFNGPSRVKPPSKHTPSALLRCQRKISYREMNAPEEKEDPAGIFWIGSRFEEDIALSFLQDSVVGEDQYVTNSLWVDFTADTDAGELKIKGETDPVIVTPDGEPLLVTEIKTKQSVEYVEEPNTHHKAQAHAYMKGLTEKHDRNVSESIILYGSRKTLDIKPFHVKFDPWFWTETVLDWAASQTTYRLNDELPPADPEQDWECDFCGFKHRCGKSDKLYDDEGPYGLLPKFTEYPKQKVRDYLDSHTGAKLTPTLAYEYPDLSKEYETYDWECGGCGETFEWGDVKFEPTRMKGPKCPECQKSALRGPLPEEKESIPGGYNDD